MSVAAAVAARVSTRAFLDRRVPGALVRELIEKAGRAPSGGNLQPWHVHALGGVALADLLAQVARQGTDPEPAYAIYPEGLSEPYRSRRYQVGEALYATLGIPREDRAGRLKQLARNATFFGAPVGLFIAVDRQMGPPQWADLGMFIQTFMLLAVEQGLSTCPQEYWALHAKTVTGFLGVPEGQMLFCGIALGYGDPDAPINALRTERAPLAEWSSFQGLDA